MTILDLRAPHSMTGVFTSKTGRSRCRGRGRRPHRRAEMDVRSLPARNARSHPKLEGRIVPQSCQRAQGPADILSDPGSLEVVK